jgi:hypothetical protein
MYGLMDEEMNERIYFYKWLIDWMIVSVNELSNESLINRLNEWWWNEKIN